MIYHKDLFPLEYTDGILFISIFFVIMLATISGIGGGGILIPIYMLVGQFNILDAAALTVLTIACNSFVRMCFLINKKHSQSIKRYLIDYTPILLIVPFDGNTSFIGLIISAIMPQWFILISIILILGFIFFKTVKKSIKQYKEERSKNFTDHKLICFDGISIYIDKDQYSAVINEDRPVETNKQRLKYIFLLIISFSLVTIFTIIRNLFDSCSKEYYIIYVCQVITILCWGIYIIWYLVKDYNKKVETNFELFPGDIKWNYATARNYAIVSSITGMLSTYLGIGGGMILAPFMINIGMVPEVVAATSSVTTFFSSVISTIQYLTIGRVKYDYGLAVAVFSLIYTFIAMKITKYIMAKYKKRYFITITLASLIGVSIILLVINGLIDMEFDSFKTDFCDDL